LSKKIYFGLSLVTISILVLMLILGIKQPSPNADLELTEISTSQATQTSSALATIASERTAIAIFTQNPTLALSSTPFYGQVIYNEVVRNLTEVPLPSRPCYLNPTNVPQNSATPISECGPFITTQLLGDEPRKIMALMEKAGIVGTVGIESYGLEGINNSDKRGFIAVQSKMGVSISLDTITDQQLINDTVTNLTDILIQSWEQLKYVSNNATISIVLSAQGQSKSLLTTYAALYKAHKSGLNGEMLIQAIDGFLAIP
jgi:hypothetical protein